MFLLNWVSMRERFETVTKLVVRILVSAAITLLVLVSGCTLFGRIIVVPHPIKGQRALRVERAEMDKGDHIAFYVLYTQAYGMEHKHQEWRSALALYRHAAQYKSPAISPEDRSAVESRIAELCAKISDESSTETDSSRK